MPMTRELYDEIWHDAKQVRANVIKSGSQESGSDPKVVVRQIGYVARLTSNICYY
jgi:hypothetical protein